MVLRSQGSLSKYTFINCSQIRSETLDLGKCVSTWPFLGFTLSIITLNEHNLDWASFLFLSACEFSISLSLFILEQWVPDKEPLKGRKKIFLVWKYQEHRLWKGRKNMWYVSLLRKIECLKFLKCLKSAV